MYRALFDETKILPLDVEEAEIVARFFSKNKVSLVYRLKIDDRLVNLVEKNQEKHSDLVYMSREKLASVIKNDLYSVSPETVKLFDFINK